MTLLRTSTALVILIFLASCGGGNESSQATSSTASSVKPSAEIPQSIKEGKGVGKTLHIELVAEIDEEMVQQGKSNYDMKCSSCHKLDEQRVVGPGFENVTNRRRPEWIMNMITNVDDMLDQDPEAKALLELCKMRMPNQNVSVEEARQLLEFMRHNDQQRTGKMDAAVNG